MKRVCSDRYGACKPAIEYSVSGEVVEKQGRNIVI